MIDVDVAIEALATLFQGAPEGAVFVTALGPNGAMRSTIGRDAGRIKDFLQRHDQSGAGLYFCVGTLRAGVNGRNKNNVGWIAGLHADVDHKDHPDVDPGEIIRRVDQTLLPASIVVGTGGGLHAYWLFREAEPATPETVARIEAALGRLAHHVGGDPSCAEISRLMRVPGSTNYKRETPILVRVLRDRPAARYEFSELEEWLGEARPLLQRRAKPNGNGAGMLYGAYAEHGGGPVDVKARLAGMKFQGEGDAAIHLTQLSVIAALLERGEDVDDVVAKVFEATRKAGDPSWNWHKEERNIRRMAESWLEKHPRQEERPQHPQHPKRTLAELHEVFRKWLGNSYDIDMINAVLAAAASERLPGDPLWLLIVGGPGGTKTETVQSLSGAGAYVTSTISSEGALLSASSRRDRAKKATGGLLRKIGDRGVLVIKDVTSILSGDRNVRASILAAIREVYDGRWERNVGTDGGQTLTWTGRIVVVGAVTTAWDAAYSVVATMGDRFVLLRPRTGAGRRAAGEGAIRNAGNELTMRQELASAVGGLVGHMDAVEHQLSEDEIDRLLNAADLVTLARSAVERDYRGDILFAHDPEAPTRFAKQLVQVLRGAVAVGLTPADGMRLALRCARDSIPPLRRDILLDLAANPSSRATDVRRRISKPRNTVRRELECLHMLGVLCCGETQETGSDGKEHSVWRYSLAAGFDQATLEEAMAG